jgi:hypothetical protein
VRWARSPRQANAGAASVTVSSWPTVSRPKSSGIKLPIVTTTNIVLKKIAGEQCTVFPLASLLAW